MEIISPPEDHYQNIYDIHLIGDGYDFEDDSLPDSSLTWYSDIDGELGKGRELKIPRLNVGNHTIKLVGIDSYNIDDTKGNRRPVHTILLKKEIFIVEHMYGLDQLFGKDFYFSALPPKIAHMGSFPVRAYAKVVLGL